MSINKHNYIGYRPTWAEVDLKAVAHNFNQVKKAVPAGTKIMATVKADAYGHGLIPVAGETFSLRSGLFWGGFN